MLPGFFGENLFDDFFYDDFENGFDKRFAMVPGFGDHNPLYGKHAKNLMKTDVREVGDAYEIDVDLPGFSKDEINVDMKDGYITIGASKSLDREQNDKKGRYIRQERYSGSCSRSFYVGDVKPSEVSAEYQDGILKLTVPKKDSKKLLGGSRIDIK